MAEFDEEELREAFSLYEKQGMIRIRDDLPNIMRILGHNPTTDEIQQFEKENPTGQIDYNEFKNIMNRSAKAGFDYDDIVMSFRIFDPEGKGSIPADQLRHVLLNLGESLSTEEFELLHQEAGGGREINYREFARIITQK